MTSQLFDIMSEQSDIDHPLCEECTNTLLDQLDHQLKVTTDELNDYSKEFVNKVESAKEDDTEALVKELEDLKMEESQLIQVYFYPIHFRNEIIVLTFSFPEVNCQR